MTTEMPLKLKIVIPDYGHTQALKEGKVPIEGVTPEFLKVEPIIAAYRRMIRDVEFDACELAATTYIVARAYGAPFKALPIFLMRRFHHSGIVCREDAGIKVPKDLEGKKVGVRAYTVTTGVWTRGVLASEYGLDLSKVTWVVDDEEHVKGLQLPANVVHVAEGESLVSMMGSGKIQAGFTSNAGIGRQGPPKAGWTGVTPPPPEIYHDLLENTDSLEAAWFKRTGIYPMHGLLVVKDSLLAAHPGLAKSLFKAFTEAKDEYCTRLRSDEEMNSREDKIYKGFMKFVGDDPLPYGIKANRSSIEALIDYAFDQKLIPRRMTVDELFVDPEA
ncbi:MAG: ABC transporter substrate-binding protein [Deltaproteobacteria bacterium]|nr:ABC transporter substrate-binding protein [Deltaproteobacteria bacterium]